MTEGRRPHRPRLPDTVGSDHPQPTSRPGLANTATADTPPRVRDLDGCREAARWRAGWRDLHKPAASGVDGRPAHVDEANRQATITALVRRG
jgi:hypothetical protein